MISKPVILITRAEPGASATARKVEGRGWTAALCPLLRIAPILNWESAEQSPTAIVLTSANGARALEHTYWNRATPIFAVGEATAGEARKQGFHTVFSADGDVTTLATLLMASRSHLGDGVLHVRGHDSAGDLAGVLAGHGIMLRTAIAYSTEPEHCWPDRMPETPPTAIMFHSPRAAQTFANVWRINAAFDLSRTIAVAISAKAILPVQALGWAQTHHAQMPNEPALLVKLDALLKD